MSSRHPSESDPTPYPPHAVIVLVGANVLSAFVGALATLAVVRFHVWGAAVGILLLGGLSIGWTLRRLIQLPAPSPGDDAVAPLIQTPPLPQPEETPPSPVALASTPIQPQGGGEFGGPLRILVVEDNAVNQQVICAMLEREGHSVYAVVNGKEAVAILAERNFDLVLMDLHMPEMDGYRATRLIRQREKAVGGHVPIIAVTANAQPNERERCLDTGMDDFLTKPISMPVLRERFGRLAASSTTSPADSTSNSGRPVWWTALAQMGLDEESLIRLLETFLETIPPRMETLRHALAESDYRQTEHSAHAIKGALAVFQMDHSANLAAQLEQLGRDKKLDGANDHFLALQRELDTLQQSMRQVIEEFPRKMEIESGSC